MNQFNPARVVREYRAIDPGLNYYIAHSEDMKIVLGINQNEKALIDFIKENYPDRRVLVGEYNFRMNRILDPVHPFTYDVK